MTVLHIFERGFLYGTDLRTGLQSRGRLPAGDQEQQAWTLRTEAVQLHTVNRQ